MAFWSENLEKAKYEKTEMSSSALRWSKAEAMEEMQRKCCSRLEREARSREERKERDVCGLSLLTMSMTSSVWRKTARCTHWLEPWSKKGTSLELVLDRAGRGGERGLNLWCGEKMGEACACEEWTGGKANTTRATSLTVLDAGNNSSRKK